MSKWFYSQNSKQRGPVDQAQFEQLVQQGAITPVTLVWREGMANWQAYGELAGLAAGAAGDSIRCVECGRYFSPDEVIKLPQGIVCEGCKPAVMQKISEGIFTTPAEQVRQAHLKHEASVKSIASLYFLSSFFVLAFGVVSIAAGGAGGVGLVMLGVVAFVMGLAQILTALALRRLDPRARVPTGIISGIGLLAFPLGTIINGYILYLVFSAKGAMVFSKEYKRIIAETPHIKYRSSLLVVILLALVVGALLLSFIGYALSRR